MGVRWGAGHTGRGEEGGGGDENARAGGELYQTHTHTHRRKDDGVVEGRERGRKRGERPLLKSKRQLIISTNHHKNDGNHRDGKGTQKPILIFKCRQAPLTFIRA